MRAGKCKANATRVRGAGRKGRKQVRGCELLNWLQALKEKHRP